MVAAIGSSLLPGTYGTANGGSMAGLGAQLARYQRELSNCVNCDSANTIEGKESIQAISSKISSVKARIEEMESAKPAMPNAATITSAGTADDSVAREEKSETAQVIESMQADKPIGRIVDAYT